MPGYCVAGTIGHKILNGVKRLELENKQTIDVKLSVQYMSFSAHADAKGIMQLISWCEPRNVIETLFSIPAYSMGFSQYLSLPKVCMLKKITSGDHQYK